MSSGADSTGHGAPGRRLPRPAELAPLLRFRRPELDATRRRLTAAFTIEDLRRIAKRRTPRVAFDYTDGAAEGEISLARARQAFQDVEFHPEVLRDVSTVDTSVTVLGGPSALPFGIAPTGFTRLMHTEGERAGASAAGAAGIPFSLSTLGTTSIEDVARANPDGRNWFQLYMWKERDRATALIERAARARFDTLLVTVDVPVSGARLRDRRNGLTIPPALGLRTVVDALPRPRWWIDLPHDRAAHLRGARRLARHRRGAPRHDVRPDGRLRRSRVDQGAVAGQARRQGHPDRRGRQAGHRRSASTGSRSPTTAAGSSTGPPFPSISSPTSCARSGGDTEVHLDTGIMNGADIVAAIALGARFTLVGRAYLYGLMAGGRAGVDRAIEILAGEITRTMRLLGARSIDELGPHHVTQLERLVPR